jgi:hypothetical protein
MDDRSGQRETLGRLQVKTVTHAEATSKLDRSKSLCFRIYEGQVGQESNLHHHSVCF